MLSISWAISASGALSRNGIPMLPTSPFLCHSRWYLFRVKESPCGLCPVMAEGVLFMVRVCLFLVKVRSAGRLRRAAGIVPGGLDGLASVLNGIVRSTFEGAIFGDIQKILAKPLCALSGAMEDDDR